MSPRPSLRSSTLTCFPRVSGDEPGGRLARGRFPGFPRVSGDEPLMGFATTDLTEFSPRERG